MTRRRLALAAMLAATPLAAVAAQATAPANGAAAAEATALPSWIERDPAAQTVTLTLDVTPKDTGGSARIAGQRGGAVAVVVPVNWTVRWRWSNTDSSAAHSLVVMPEREKVPVQGGTPAFPNALTRQVVDGLPVGSRDRTTFTAEQGGWYWVLCGVPGHAADGEWIGLRVDPRATDVGVRTRPPS
jgi:hypothetical protein